MIRVEIETVWRFTRESDSGSMLVMLGFLNEIRASGKITRAAEGANVSYRHAWNLIEKWSEFFGTQLVERRRGHGTNLTAFGEKLVWAGQRLQARLGPQLQNLGQELQSEINALLPNSVSVLRVHASHGFAVSCLRELLGKQTGLSVDFRFVGNANSLVSLANGSCDLAGMHLPQGALRKQYVAASRRLVSPGTHRVIGFVTREMGLMVRRGNPLEIRSVADLRNPAIRFVNRDPDSGSRVLFDQLLKEGGVDGARISGYEHGEFTHAAVAAYVASGMADVSFGVEAAARQFDLDFVRLVTEDYFFVCRQDILETEPVRRILSVMRSEAFYQAISALPGYRVNEPGAVLTMQEVFRSTQ
ncbi:MAG: substrate-binding domain-containing protein [Pseudomonadota bacterium]